MVLISQNHEDENTDLMLSLSVRVKSVFTRFFESDETATWGRSFCGISNRVLGSMLVMIRRDRHWQVGVCAFHFQQEIRTFPNQHKVSVPSYFRFTSQSY